MKKNRIFGLASGLALLLAGGCSNDVIDPGNEDDKNVVNPEDGVYLAINFDLPSAKETRSFTEKPNESNSGTEAGHDYENSVSSAYIVLAKTDNSFITGVKVLKDNIDQVGASGISYRSTADVNKTALLEYYNTATEADKDINGFNVVNVFVFANPTSGLEDALMRAKFGDTKWYDALGRYDETDGKAGEGAAEIWKKDEFLMSNSQIATRRIPSTLEEWDNFSTKASAFNLSGMNNFGRPNEINNLETGNILIERTAARYDFRDGALDGIGNTDKTYNGFKAQTYHVVLDSDENPLVDVMLGKMSMVNMNKEYYFLRRVSRDGLEANWSICGPEMPWYTNASGAGYDQSGTGNYVVDAFSSWKNSSPETGFASHFNYPFFNEDGIMDNAETSSDSWYTSLISKVLTEGASDSWNAEEGKGKYKTWRYLTEGTIPGINTQQNGISNGIVFKGQLQPARSAVDGDDEFTKKLLEVLNVSESGNKLHDPILYVYAGHVYCTWEHIKRMAIFLSLRSISWNEGANKWDFNINRSTALYNAVFGTGGFGEVGFTCEKTGTLENANFLKNGEQTLKDDLAADPNCANTKYSDWKEAFPGSDEEVEDSEAQELQYFNNFRKAAVNSNIALYQTSYDKDLGGWGYYCYYYYWNRHNDNGQNGSMGPMEFAVVRNNVYKLAVTKIARLGHPRISANDPDKPTPNTPDEKGDVYITVTCTTIPWVVRENNIEF